MDFTVSETENGMRLSSFLREVCLLSRHIVSRAKFEQAIFVNGLPVYTSHILKSGDTVTLNFTLRRSEHVIAQKDIMPPILFEDEHIIAVNKPPQMPSHPSYGHSVGTLANAVAGYYEKCGIETAVRILGRLDTDTSGVVIICKNPYISKLLCETKINKLYFALCEGQFSPQCGKIDLPIEKSENEGTKRVVSPTGKNAVTLYETQQCKNGFSLMRLQLLTGRTHQIRVHLSHMGHPIIGDEIYGGQMLLPRQALHCGEISFTNPLSGKSFSVSAPLPQDFNRFISEYMK